MQAIRRIAPESVAPNPATASTNSTLDAVFDGEGAFTSQPRPGTSGRIFALIDVLEVPAAKKTTKPGESDELSKPAIARWSATITVAGKLIEVISRTLELSRPGNMPFYIDGPLPSNWVFSVSPSAGVKYKVYLLG
ncbi:MAG: hypothetical protein ACRC4J_03570 [Cetobacterium sp.]